MFFQGVNHKEAVKNKKKKKKIIKKHSLLIQTFFFPWCLTFHFFLRRNISRRKEIKEGIKVISRLIGKKTGKLEENHSLVIFMGLPRLELLLGSN